MKKLVLLLAVVFGMSMVSCTGTTEATQDGADTTAVVVEETMPVENDTTVKDSNAVAQPEAAAPEAAAPADTTAK